MPNKKTTSLRKRRFSSSSGEREISKNKKDASKPEKILNQTQSSIENARKMIQSLNLKLKTKSEVLNKASNSALNKASKTSNKNEKNEKRQQDVAKNSKPLLKINFDEKKPSHLSFKLRPQQKQTIQNIPLKKIKINQISQNDEKSKKIDNKNKKHDKKHEKTKNFSIQKSSRNSLEKSDKTRKIKRKSDKNDKNCKKDDKNVRNFKNDKKEKFDKKDEKNRSNLKILHNNSKKKQKIEQKPKIENFGKNKEKDHNFEKNYKSELSVREEFEKIRQILWNFNASLVNKISEEVIIRMRSQESSFKKAKIFFENPKSFQSIDIINNEFQYGQNVVFVKNVPFDYSLQQVGMYFSDFINSQINSNVQSIRDVTAPPELNNIIVINFYSQQFANMALRLDCSYFGENKIKILKKLPLEEIKFGEEISPFKNSGNWDKKPSLETVNKNNDWKTTRDALANAEISINSKLAIVLSNIPYEITPQELYKHLNKFLDKKFSEEIEYIKEMRVLNEGTLIILAKNVRLYHGILDLKDQIFILNRTISIRPFIDDGSVTFESLRKVNFIEDNQKSSQRLVFDNIQGETPSEEFKRQINNFLNKYFGIPQENPKDFIEEMIPPVKIFRKKALITFTTPDAAVAALTLNKTWKFRGKTVSVSMTCVDNH